MFYLIRTQEAGTKDEVHDNSVSERARGVAPAMEDFVFLLAAGLCVLSACAIVTCKNPVYSVILMLPFFLGMATLFTLLQASFLAAMEIMVYGGAILVVFLFVIMLINLRPEDLKDDFNFATYFTYVVLCGLVGGMILSFARAGVPHDGPLEKAFAQEIGVLQPDEAAPKEAAAAEGEAQDGASKPAAAPAPAQRKGRAAFGSVGSLGVPLFTQFMIPFELIGLLLTVAILGAMVLSKKKA
ncbi:MAG: NADH-quinone oxidoreductase subunit J [Planctomycetota bacterium]|nr:NADH-quinone oxidoreductase subunit J [Planctomycetota bacterium]